MNHAEVTIRPFAARDADTVASLLQALWLHDPTMLVLYQSMHRVWQSDSLIRQTLVATTNDTIVGVGTLFESTIHPWMLMATLNVAAAWQRRGIGAQLWAALKALGDGRPWLVKATRRDHAGMNFLQTRGFQPLVGTLTGLLDPEQPPVQAWLAGLPADVPGYTIARIDATSAIPHEVALVHAAIYRQNHTWNPPVEESMERAIAHYCGPNVIPGSQLCVYRGEQLVGAANLIANPFQPSDHEAYLVNLGVVDLPPVAAESLTGALIRRSVEFAANRRLRVRFEADDPHQPFQSWLMTAPATEVDHDFVIMANS